MKRDFDIAKFSFVGKLLVIFIFIFVLNFIELGNYLRNFVLVVGNPLESTISNYSRGYYSFWSNFSDYFNLRDEYNQLKIDEARKEADLARIRNLEAEVATLKQQLELANTEAKYLEVEIISSGVIEKNDYFLINKGSRDGMKKGMIVSIGNVYIGLISEGFENTSKVVTPYDNKNFLQVQIISNESNNSTITSQLGVEHANGVMNGSIAGVKVDNISLGSKVQENYFVEINDSKVNESLIVGTVLKIEENPSNATKSAMVKPIYEVKDLKYVFVRL